MEAESSGREGVEEYDREMWVTGSFDHTGTTALRASTGAWKAAVFVIAIEFTERLTYYGIATNLITYLTGVLHEDLKTAAKMSNYWAGVTTITPLIGGFLADAYFGGYTMIMISSILYFMGLSLLTMSEFIPTLKSCDQVHACQHHHQEKIHEVVFFVALYMLSLATGGHKPCLESFGANQFDDEHARERKQKMSFFNWWNIGLTSGILLGTTLIVYLQDNLGWGVASLILAISMGISIAVFYLGRTRYRYKVPEGSPLTPVLQVLVAAFRNHHLPHADNYRLLNEVHGRVKPGTRLLHHTDNLKFLDKAAIIQQDHLGENNHNPWRLSTVTKVEETKLLINMLPIWLTSLIFGVSLAQTSTFFVKQSSALNRKLGPRFEIPPAAIFSLSSLGMLCTVIFYEKVLVPILRRTTGNERGISILQRIGVGMVLTVVAMATAALVERKRLSAAEKDVGAPRMSVFWLAPQYILYGVGDGFSLVGLQEYFYDQVPDSMRSLGMAFYLSVIGVGSFVSSLLITIVNHITKKISGRSWIGSDLNSSRVDKFYWLLTVISAVNTVVYVFIARRISYKNVQRNVGEVDGGEEARTESLA